MSTILVLTSSALGTASVSNQLAQDAIARLHLQDPDRRIVTRDLGGNPIPHLTVESATALRGAEPVNAEQTAARALSDELIAEIKAADTLVVGAPMYNFGIASTLKTWFDYVLRAGITFKYSESGPVNGQLRLSIWPRDGLGARALRSSLVDAGVAPKRSGSGLNGNSRSTALPLFTTAVRFFASIRFSAESRAVVP